MSGHKRSDRIARPGYNALRPDRPAPTPAGKAVMRRMRPGRVAAMPPAPAAPIEPYLDFVTVAIHNVWGPALWENIPHPILKDHRAAVLVKARWEGPLQVGSVITRPGTDEFLTVVHYLPRFDAHSFAHIYCVPAADAAAHLMTQLGRVRKYQSPGARIAPARTATRTARARRKAVRPRAIPRRRTAATRGRAR